MTTINITSDQTVYIGQESGYLYCDTGYGHVVLSGPITINQTDSGVGHVYIQTDITIQSSNEYFIGGSGAFVFDGQGHDVTLDASALGYGGLFSNLTVDQTVQNIDLIGGGGTLADYAGAVVGSLAGHVINCTSSVDVSSVGSGGIVGAHAVSGTVENCYSTGDVSGDYSGGIVGYSAADSGETVAVSNCYSTGSISGTQAGGIIGSDAAFTIGNVQISNCYSIGDVSGVQAGGIAGSSAGDNGGSVAISNSYSTGTISGDYSGGIVGSSLGNNGGEVTINSAYSTGAIVGYGSGGIVGGYAQSGSINGCYSTGEIAGLFAGGIVGISAANYSLDPVVLSNCYTTGSISGQGVGGIVGALAAANGGEVSISGCFTVGSIVGMSAGGIVGSNAGFTGGNVDISASYSTGVINGDYSGGIAGASAGDAGGTVTIDNVFASGDIQGVDVGGIVGPGSIGYGSTGGFVTVAHAYTSGLSSSVYPNGIFAYSDISGDPNLDNPVGYGTDNYSEANNGNSGMWNNANAYPTLISVPVSTSWVDSYAPNVPYTLVAFSPTVNSTSTLSGAIYGGIYDLTFANLFGASGATGQFNTVESFEVTANTSSGSFFTGTSYATATPFYTTATLDSTHHIYWVPNELGAVNFGSALAVGYIENLGQQFNSATSTAVNFSISPPPPTPSGDTSNVGGFVLTKQPMSNNATVASGDSTVTTLGNVQCMGGAAQNNPLSAQNISNVSAGQVNTMPTLMAVKIQKIIGLIGAVTAEMAESMSHSSGLLASSDSTKIAGSSMIAPPNATVPAEAITQAASDTPMEATAYPVYGYNYFYLSDFQGSSNFRVTSQSSNPLTTNFLELINNTGGSQTVDIAGYQGIVVATPGVNVTGLTANNYLGTFGGGSYTFGAGNQKLFLMGPNSSIVGGGGIDTVRFLGVGKGGAFINQQGNDVTIWSDWLDTGSGVTYLHNVARAQFDDGSVAFDTGAGQNAGEVFRLYEAAFHRVGDQQGMGYWINQLDNGTSLQAVANQFLSSQEFINLYGSSTSSAQYVTALYNNVLGRAPDATGAAYWQSQLQAGASKAQILIQFAESVEGVSHTASQMAHGVQYQQWVQ